MALNENAKKWVDALRSGEYKQTRKRLRDSYGFCCLGVACDVAIKSGVVMDVRRRNTETGHVLYFDNESGFPPKLVLEWLGLKTVAQLMALNDHKGYNFNQIADFIEEYADRLFVAS